MSLDKESSDNDKSCGQIKQDPEEIKQELAISGHGPAVIDPLARPWDEILSITSIDVQPDIDRLLLRRRDEEIHSLLINSSELPTVIGVIDIEVYPQFCWDIDIMPAEKPIQAIVRLSLLRALGKVSRRLLGTEYDSSILGPEGRFIGPLHRIEETDALNNAMIRSHDENVFNSVKRTMKIATRLATICEIVGEGCIFVLYKELTDDFLFLLDDASGGLPFNVSQHLTKLELIPLLVSTGAMRLAHDLLAHWVSVYKIDQIEQVNPELIRPRD